MRLDGFDPTPGDSPIDRVDPRVKLILTLVYVVAVVASPVGWWWTLGGGGGHPGRRDLGLAPAAWRPGPPLARVRDPGPLPRGDGGRRASGPWRDRVRGRDGLDRAQEQPRVPGRARPGRHHAVPATAQRLATPGGARVLVATLHFMSRYVHVLLDELGRMIQARRSRSFRRSGPDWGLLTGLIGVLFLRSMERGERVHAAMLARGWDGTIRTLDGADAP